MDASADPFHHLHDEGFERRFDAPLITRQSMVFMGGRAAESLDGPWRFTIDPFDEGLRQGWYAYPERPVDEWEAPRDYDPWSGATAPVPSCWNVQAPELTHYEGAAWYSRALDGERLSTRPGERLFLRVGAATATARVFLNGAFLGRHKGGSTPFFVDLTGLGRPGRNLLMIQVSNRRQTDLVPMRHFDWFNYGGLYREVSLVRVPDTFIRHLAVALVPDGGFSSLRLRAEVAGVAPPPVRFRVPELGLDVAVPVLDGVAETVVEARPAPWSPEDPRLYDVGAACGADRVSDRVGFREIRVEGNRILLNGRSIYLRGISVHEDDRDLGKVNTPALIERMFRDARELNCNFLRLSHYPHHEAVARRADELGFLLWEEIPVYWAIDFANPETYADAENQLREMIRRDANRASVIVWGVGNENADTDPRLSFMARLAAAARAEDSTRAVAAACLLDFARMRINDRLAAHLDIVGVNEYFGWYVREVEDFAEFGRNSDPGKPVIITETGADARAGLRQGAGRFTEDYQADLFRRQFAVLDGLDYVRGATPWLLYDFRSERRQTAFHGGHNRKGLIAEDKTTRKMAFETLAAIYRRNRR